MTANIVDAAAHILGFLSANRGRAAFRPAAAAKIDQEGRVAEFVEGVRFLQERRLAGGVAVKHCNAPLGLGMRDMPGLQSQAGGTLQVVNVARESQGLRSRRIRGSGDADASCQNSCLLPEAHFLWLRWPNPPFSKVGECVGMQKTDEVEKKHACAHTSADGKFDVRAQPANGPARGEECHDAAAYSEGK